MKKNDSIYGVKKCDEWIKIKMIKINENEKNWQREWCEKKCAKVQKILSVRMLGFFLWEREWCGFFVFVFFFVIEN